MSDYPTIARVGLSGVAVTFGESLSEEANLAAIAFRSAVDAQGWEEVSETASTLVSTYLAVDLAQHDLATVTDRLKGLLGTRDWLRAEPPRARKLWTLPMCFEAEAAPQLDEVAHEVGLSAAQVRRDLGNTRTRIITLGYAPGQPYMGLLPPIWDLPRQSHLTPNVPAGALVIAIRQFVLFTAAMPTGWRHVGQTAFRPFDPDRDTAIAFAPGDEVRFAPIDVRSLRALEAGDSWGGATWEALP